MGFVTLIVKSTSFFPQTMSLTHVKDHKSLKELEKNKSCVVLVTGKGCRACTRVKKPFYSLSQKHEQVDMYEITLNDFSLGKSLNKSIMSYSKKNGVRTIPTLLFQKEESVSLISVNPKNLQEIEEMIRSM